jgi:hypothetical protein
MAYSVWQIRPIKAGSLSTVETLLFEVETQEQAEQIASRYREGGHNVKIMGPHEPQNEDYDFPLQY